MCCSPHGSRGWDRTTVDGFKVRCPAARRPGNGRCPAWACCSLASLEPRLRPAHAPPDPQNCPVGPLDCLPLPHIVPDRLRSYAPGAQADTVEEREHSSGLADRFGGHSRGSGFPVHPFAATGPSGSGRGTPSSASVGSSDARGSLTGCPLRKPTDGDHGRRRCRALTVTFVPEGGPAAVRQQFWVAAQHWFGEPLPSSR